MIGAITAQWGKLATAPAFFAVGSVATVALADTVDVTLPAGLADGDYALLLVAIDTDTVSSVSMGSFAGLATSSQGVIGDAEVWGSPVGAADSSVTATVQFGGPVTAGQVVFIVYRGAVATDPDFSASAHGTSTAITQPGVTSSGVGTAVVLSISATVAASSPPATWTERLDAGTGFRLLADDKAVTAGVVAAASRSQVSGAWVTFEGVFYP